MASSLYPIMYLSELFVPYDSFLEIDILSTSISSILDGFLMVNEKSLKIFL